MGDTPLNENWGHSFGFAFRPFSVVAVGAVRKDGGGEDGTTGKFSSPLQFHPETQSQSTVLVGTQYGASLKSLT